MSRRGGAWRSWRLPSSHAQAREKQLLVLRVAERQVGWPHLGRQHAQPVDHLARCVEPSQMGIARG